MLVLTEATYLRPSILQGRSVLSAADYDALHVRRIAFAREALFGARHTLPSWYPHEFLGAPFSANLQGFPWTPTRFVLFLFDPLVAFAAGVAVAAALSALFTYLYCRRAGLSQTASAAAGWTFACAGYFVSRVTVGHLPLLEAYPALPLLLWLADRALDPARAHRQRVDLALLAICSACIAVAGHPQVPAYALISTLLYVVWCGRGWVRARIVCALGLGVGMTLVVWWPMLLLIGRSMRVLHLGPPDNDIPLSFGRMLALVYPGVDGWSEPLALAARKPFDGYPNSAYFWDTVSYVGVVPLIALVLLLVGCIRRKRWPDSRWIALSLLGLGALLLALPLVEPLRQMIPGTMFRSPARLLYISTFCAAAGFGAAINAVRRHPLLLGVILAIHFVDLAAFDRNFIVLNPRRPEPPEFLTVLDREVGSGRIAADDDLQFTYADRYDDLGGFDSIFLADSYRAILALNHLPHDFNEQQWDGAGLSVEALEASGVRYVITTDLRHDLNFSESDRFANLYRVANPAPRAAFFPSEKTEFLPETDLIARFVRQPRADRLLLPSESRKYLCGVGGPAQGTAEYARPSSDDIVLQVSAGQEGFAQVLEAYDPGWSATVDGAAAPVLKANGFVIAVPVSPGSHTVRLRYQTPGRALGGAMSLVSAFLLVGLIVATASRRASIPGGSASS